MPSKILYASLFVIAAVLALALGPDTPIGAAIWPPADAMPEPSGAQLAGFIGYGVFSALAFGAGAVLVLALARRVSGVTEQRGLAIANVVAVGWLTMSWVPHDNLHRMVGTDPGGLLALEWGFHATLIVAAIMVAVYLLRSWPATGDAAPRARPVGGRPA